MEAPGSPRTSGRRGGWGPNPVGPAQAGRAMSARAALGIGWFVVVLMSCTDCRSRRGDSTMEGVLVPAKRLPLTRQRPRRNLAAVNAGRTERSGSRGGRDRGRQRPGDMLGPRLKTPRSGGNAWKGFRSKLSQDHATLHQGNLEGCSKAEAGGSPSSEASPDDVSRRAVGSQDHAAGRRARSGFGQRRGCSYRSRLQKSERRIFLAGTEKRGATCEEPGAAG